jgi:hypothetical protein
VSVNGVIGASTPPTAFQLAMRPVKMSLSWRRVNVEMRLVRWTKTAIASYPMIAYWIRSRFSAGASPRERPVSSASPATTISSPLPEPWVSMLPNGMPVLAVNARAAAGMIVSPSVDDPT